jgi:hypothetical protein
MIYKEPAVGKLIFGNEWDIHRIQKINVNGDSKIDLSQFNKSDSETSGEVKNIGDIMLIDLNVSSGQEFYKDKLVGGYDESILNFESLEGSARATSHSYVFSEENQWVPTNYLTLNIYTKSKILRDQDKTGLIRYTDGKLEELITKDYINERNKILEVVPHSSFLFIDGPLFSGRVTSSNFTMIEGLLEQKGVKTFFIKKGCTSDHIVNSLPEAKGYNSDIHWANSKLKTFPSRTSLFSYTSGDGRSKVYCYMKIYKNRSPLRVEFTYQTYEVLRTEIDNIMNMIAYLYYVDGNLKSPQLRQIAIAEKYARETLKVTNIYKTIYKFGLTPTQNEVRF